MPVPLVTVEDIEAALGRPLTDSESARAPFIADKLGLQASTVGRVLRRHHVPLLRELDPVTGSVIRATRRSATARACPIAGCA